MGCLDGFLKRDIHRTGWLDNFLRRDKHGVVESENEMGFRTTNKQTNNRPMG